MPAAAVTPPPGLDPRARWALDCLLAAAGGCVVESGAPELDVARLPLELERAGFHLARVEESAPAPEDEHGRFPAVASCLRADEAPLDDLVQGLREQLRELGLQPAAPGPGGARFAVALTHDIDTPRRWVGRAPLGAAARTKAALASRQLSLAANEAAGLALAPWHRLRGSDPNWSFGRIAQLEAARGFASTSYVLGAHRDPHDGAAPEAYADRRLELVRELASLGEVALHASYRAGESEALLVEERATLAAALGQPVVGNRFHYLRMTWHDVLPRLEAAGLTHDSSLGYAARPGARAGLSFPFAPWLLDEGRPARLLELPLLLMDATLAEERYLGLSPEQGREVVDRLLDHLAAVGGAGAVLWHNDRFDRVYARGWDGVYEHLLDGIASRGGWAGTSGELASWWRSER